MNLLQDFFLIDLFWKSMFGKLRANKQTNFLQKRLMKKLSLVLQSPKLPFTSRSWLSLCLQYRSTAAV